jgi:hypothetical protein
MRNFLLLVLLVGVGLVSSRDTPRSCSLLEERGEAGTSIFLCEDRGIAYILGPVLDAEREKEGWVYDTVISSSGFYLNEDTWTLDSDVKDIKIQAPKAKRQTDSHILDTSLTKGTRKFLIVRVRDTRGNAAADSSAHSDFSNAVFGSGFSYRSQSLSFFFKLLI